MTNKVYDGNVILFVNSGSAIESGDVVVIGNRIGVALVDIDATTGSGAVELVGVFEISKHQGETFAQGDQLFWDISNQRLTKVATGNIHAGFCFEAPISSSYARLLLSPLPLRMPVQAASVAGDVAALLVDFNLLLGKLKAAGLMANS